MSKFLYFVLGLFFIAACSEQPTGEEFKLSGQLFDAPNKEVQLNQISLQGQRTLIASTQTDARGNFQLVTNKSIAEAIYQLSIGHKKVSFVLNGEDKDLTIKGNYGDFEKYNFDLSGSSLTGSQVLSYHKIISEDWPEVMVLDYFNNMENTLVALQTGIAFLMKTPDEYKNVRALAPRVEEDLSHTPYANEFKEFVKYYDGKVRENVEGAQQASLLNIGDQAPEIAQPNPDGKIMKLSDLRGKVVLLDFWASWCAPCRRANPHVVSLYNKYKDKGFTVYSVSLDRNGQKDKWVAAIEQDKLAWESHVSDLKYWQSAPAQTYGVRAIPATYLLDRNGIIRKINPRNNLEASIKELL
ncbi:peroxiredoxin family protein [Membranihabitans marinus]|uniref:peroxiredoxin family protein n=1 Tax=Membranihabitans marinus TaxID=1227546 RepID=UPI001F46B165|nr:TlpA disulfide reductase family protein [Membranihabitans marinus]